MRAHVGRVLAALTPDELREVRDRLDVIARDAGHPGAIASVADVNVSVEELILSGEEVIGSGEELIDSGREQGAEQTVDDRSGWILERRG